MNDTYEMFKVIASSTKDDNVKCIAQIAIRAMDTMDTENIKYTTEVRKLKSDLKSKEIELASLRMANAAWKMQINSSTKTNDKKDD